MPSGMPFTFRSVETSGKATEGPFLNFPEVGYPDKSYNAKIM
jgi:hypothetical protein